MKIFNNDKVRYVILFLFVFSIPFQNWIPFEFFAGITFSWMLGVLYFLISLYNINRSTFKLVKKPVLWLLVFLLITTLINILTYIESAERSIFNARFLQNTLLFGLVSIDIISNRNLIKWLFLSLILSVFTMSVLTNLGIGVEVSWQSELEDGRFRFFGANSNDLGDYIAFSLIMLTALLVDREKYFKKKTFLLLLLVPNILFVLGITGSRGALIIFFIGTISQFLFRKTTLVRRILLIIVGGIVFGYALREISTNQVVIDRIDESERRGALSNRTPVWENSLNIFLDNPIFGAGAHGFERRTMLTLGEYADSHNMFLFILATGGLVGFFIFMGFIWNLLTASISSFRNSNSVLVIVLFVAYLLVVSKSGGAINNKFYWLIAAFIYGMGSQKKLKLRKKASH